MALPISPEYLKQPESDFSERIRALRTHLFRLFFQSGGKSLLITSAWRGEGKSSVGLNLAASLAELGHRVLLCDANLRSQGLARTSLNRAAWDGAPHSSTEIPGVSIMLMAPEEISDLSAYLGAINHRQKLFEHFVKFPMVLVDGPSLSDSGDGFALARLLDGVLLVVSRSKFGGVAEGHFSEDLRDYGARIVGVVTVP